MNGSVFCKKERRLFMLINEDKKQHISILHAFYLETIDGICNTDLEKSRMKCYIKSYKKL